MPPTGGDENSPSHSAMAGTRRGPEEALKSPSKKAVRAERRVPWPQHIPVNDQLKGTSRSTLQPLTAARLRAQEHIDPDFLFVQPLDDLPIKQMFAAFPEASKYATENRGISGDWRTDAFTEAEEAAYKESMGFTPGAPNQARAVQDAVHGVLRR